MNDKVWIITGASRGFGLATAKNAIASGYKVAMLARGEEVFTEAEKLGANALGLRVDITSQQSIDDGMRQVIEKWQRVDVLINNAGLHRGGLIQELSFDDWEAVLDTNLSGPFRMIRAALAYMHDGAAIINIGAVVGGRGFTGDAPYGASKNGLKGLTRVLAVELARRGIRVNLVIPGFVMTEMTDMISDKARETIVAKVPLQRTGLPEEIAEVIGWVAQSSYMTGAVVPVDGGLSCGL
jgi:NAD(P)-dependent dehydrogenase (short-subunit alcohol dehydrogenase family)